VEVNTEAVERALDLLEHARYGILVARSQLVDIRASVAVLGRLLPAPPRIDGGPELLHLSAGVVVVVLALDLVAGELQQAGDRVAVGSVPRRGHRDRAGRVRGDHLDLDALAGLGLACAEFPATLEHTGPCLGQPF